MKKLILLSVAFCFTIQFYAQDKQQVIVDSEEYRSLKISGELLKGNYEIIQPAIKPNEVRPSGVIKSAGGGGGGIPTDCDCWQEPDATYTQTNFGANGTDDGSTNEINLPFDFELYGETYDSFWINTNGNITFEGPFTTFTPDGFPVSNAMLAPMWCDVDFGCADCGEVFYKVTDDAVFVNWVEVGYFNNHSDKVNTFQAIFTPAGSSVLPGDQNVQYCYREIEWSTGDITGDNGFGGQGATVGANAGNNIDFIQFGRFDQPGDDYDGPFGNQDGVDWLDFQTFGFNSNSSNNDNLAPIVVGPVICDTIVMCQNDVLNFDYSFLGPEDNQDLTITLNDGNFPNIESEIVQGNPASLNFSLTTDIDEAGSYEISFTVTDDGTPSESITTVINIEVIGVVVPDLDIVVDGEIVDFISYCAGQDGAELTGSDGFDAYVWSDGTEEQSDFFEQGTYTLTGFFMGCDTEAGPINVFEIPVFNPDVSIEDLFLCAGESTEISIDNSEDYESVEWVVFNNDGTILSADTEADTIEVTPGFYEVQVIDENGCPGSRIVPVVEEIVNIPNTNFSPQCDDNIISWSGAWAEPESCLHQINLFDSEMDTWEGANIQVLIDNTGPFNFSILNGAGFAPDGIVPFHGQLIEYFWQPGLDDDDIDVQLLDGNGQIVFDTTDGDVLVGGDLPFYTTIADCGFNSLEGQWLVEAPAGGENWTLETESEFNPVNGSNTFTAPEGFVGTYGLTFQSEVCASEVTFDLSFSTTPTVTGIDYNGCGEVTIEPTFGPASLNGDFEYNWSPNVLGPCDGFPTCTVTESIAYTIEVSNECGENDFDGFVIITPEPTAELFNITLCDSETAVLDPGNEAQDATYAWNDGSSDETLFVNSGGEYSVDITNDCGTASAAASVTQILSPSVNPWAFDTLVCNGNEINIDPLWSNLTTPVLWTMEYTDTAGGFNSEVLNGTGPSFLFLASQIPSVAENNSVTVSYSTANECGVSQGEVIIFKDACFISATNVFTPDSDGNQNGRFQGGLNEGWFVFGIDGIAGVGVRIYDRWGGIVFEDDNYNNSAPWTGENQNGNELSEGVYFYFIKIPQREEEITGTVTLLRNQ